MDLTTTYLGMTLKNPIVPGASPLSKSLDGIRRMEDAGAGAVVMYSLFEEQIDAESKQLDHYLSYGTDTYSEALSYFPELDNYNIGPDEYLKLISDAKKATKIPIIGSLNGLSKGGWTNFAKQIEQAGADALELNVYYVPTDPAITGQEIDQMYVDTLMQVSQSVSIPVAIKVGPQFSSTAYMAKRLSESGAKGLVMFNRFYQPDFNLETMEVEPTLVLSNSNDMRLPLRWIAILHGRIEADFAISSGVHTHLDVLKALMAGANVTQVVSELLHGGVGRIGEILKDMTAWMEANEYSSVQQMRGSMSQKNIAEPAAFERANYMKVLTSISQDPTGKFV